ncbi:uncharacterized protein JN550_012790 [Neoarthrinium moseri]|uniref:uncharacterized protein n=1 Tax=Neoarthrinium moseri TaxID=1658444 RepID=UPI001FDE778B|nr:uncharacterized protein JN550_012790 [Neoarthrinium moseri]KAI1858340.1 hypothetical protein JN550_012790 [Neoarthrinium moseri]
MSISDCCIRGFTWDGTPTGQVGKLANNDAYITGSNPDKAVLLVHDLFGWTFSNNRLLADHYAKEADATVYVPDFFGGDVVPSDDIIGGHWDKIDLKGFLEKHARAVREPEIFACARALRAKHARVGAVGYCYGGWACFRLASAEHQPPLVDCISTGHPSLLEKADIDGVGRVPVQVLAAEFDQAYTEELKLHTFQALQKLGVAFDYQHFPGVEHGCLVRGDEKKDGERAAMVRGKNAAVAWFKQYLDAE